MLYPDFLSELSYILPKFIQHILLSIINYTGSSTIILCDNTHLSYDNGITYFHQLCIWQL